MQIASILEGYRDMGKRQKKDRCIALTVKGERCKKNVLRDIDYCSIHKHLAKSKSLSSDKKDAKLAETLTVGVALITLLEKAQKYLPEFVYKCMELASIVLAARPPIPGREAPYLGPIYKEKYSDLDADKLELHLSLLRREKDHPMFSHIIDSIEGGASKKLLVIPSDSGIPTELIEEINDAIEQWNALLMERDGTMRMWNS